MIKILEGNDFLIQEYLEEYIEKKFAGIDEQKRKFAIVRNPSSISVITNSSPFTIDDKVIIWDFDEFKKLERFNPYVIPKGVDIFIIGQKIDKRLIVVKQAQSYQAEVKLFKDLYPNQVEAWILNRKKKINIQIQPDAVRMLALMYGSNLGELAKLLDELKKLNKIITKDIVIKVGSTVNEFSIFELQDEILAQRVNKSLYIVEQMLKSEQPIGIIRYFVNAYDKLILIKSKDSKIIEGLKLHPFILKKLDDTSMTIEKCLKALDILRLAEQYILWGIDAKFVLLRMTYRLCRI